MRPPVDSVQLVNITPITMVHGTQISIVTGAYKRTYISGGATLYVLFFYFYLTMLNGCEWFVCWFMNRFDFENVIIISTIPIAIKFQQLIYSDIYIYIYIYYRYYIYKPPFLRGTLRHPRRQGRPRMGKKPGGGGWVVSVPNGHGSSRAVHSLVTSPSGH